MTEKLPRKVGLRAVEGSLMPPTPETNLPATSDQPYVAEVELGMIRFMQITKERNELRTRLDDVTLENERLKIEIDNAREGERLRTQRIVDESVLAGRRAETENQLLREEAADLRRRMDLDRREHNEQLAAARLAAAEARAEVMRLTAFAELIRAAVDKTLENAPTLTDRSDK